MGDPVHGFCVGAERVWHFSVISPDDSLRQSGQGCGDHFRLRLVHLADHRAHRKNDDAVLRLIDPVEQVFVLDRLSFLAVKASDELHVGHQWTRVLKREVCSKHIFESIIVAKLISLTRDFYLQSDLF